MTPLDGVKARLFVVLGLFLVSCDALRGGFVSHGGY
jgi:hypothetical protein